MAAQRWTADGIEAAEACGGITLEKQRRIGFGAKAEVRQRPRGELQISGFPIEVDPDPYEDDDGSS